MTTAVAPAGTPVPGPVTTSGRASPGISGTEDQPPADVRESSARTGVMPWNSEPTGSPSSYQPTTSATTWTVPLPTAKTTCPLAPTRDVTRSGTVWPGAKTTLAVYGGA